VAAPVLVQAVTAVVVAGGVVAGWRVVQRKASAIDARRIDPFTLVDPWRGFVQSAQSAAARFDRIMASVDAGPLRDRLGEIDTQVGQGVDVCWRIAQQGHALHRTLLEVSAGAADSAPVARMRATEKTTADQLASLIKNLNEAVARAAELATSQTADLTPLAKDVTGVVDDLEALRQAILEVDRLAEPPQA
jgi:hypothetical protein